MKLETKRLKEIGENVAVAVGLPILAAYFLVLICVTGMLFLLFVDWITRPIFGDWWNYLRQSQTVALAVCTIVGGLVWWCCFLISRVWKRKVAIEEEIKPVLDIQIIEPPPPGRVEKFAERIGGATERFYDRYFGWADKIQNDRLRGTVGWLIFCVIAFPVGRIAIWA